MLIRSSPGALIRFITGITLITVGVLWESVAGPSLLGWMAIAAGLLVQRLVRRCGFRRTPLELPVFLLIFMSAGSLGVTASFDVTLAQVTRLGAGLAAFYGVVQWARPRRHLIYTAAALTAMGSLVALAAPVAVAWNETKGGLIPISFYQIFPLVLADPVHPNIMATLMVIFFPLPLAYFFASRPGGPRLLQLKWVLLVVSGGAMMLVLFLTKSRGGYLAGAAAVVIVVWLCRGRVLASILAAIFIVAGAWIAVIGTQQTWEVAKGITNPSTWAFRQHVWHTALWIIADFPFTGVGMGTFNDVATRLYPFSVTSNPGAHNIFLQVGLDLGILGLVAFLSTLLLTASMGVLAIRILKNGGDRTLYATAVGGTASIIAFILHGLVDNTVWGTRMAFVPWMIIGLVVALYLYTRSPPVYELAATND